MPDEKPFLEADGVKLYTDPKNASALTGKSLDEVVKQQLSRLGAGDYAAVIAYVERTRPIAIRCNTSAP